MRGENLFLLQFNKTNLNAILGYKFRNLYVDTLFMYTLGRLTVYSSYINRVATTLNLKAILCHRNSTITQLLHSCRVRTCVF